MRGKVAGYIVAIVLASVAYVGLGSQRALALQGPFQCAPLSINPSAPNGSFFLIANDTNGQPVCNSNTGGGIASVSIGGTTAVPQLGYSTNSVLDAFVTINSGPCTAGTFNSTLGGSVSSPANTSFSCNVTFTFTNNLANIISAWVVTGTYSSNAGAVTFASTITLSTGSNTPSLSLTTTANPATFSAAGQTINYTNTVTNTGTVAIGPTTVSGAKTGSCVTTSIAVGASAQCASTYTTVAGDVGAPVAFAATVSGAPAAGGSNVTATAQGTVPFDNIVNPNPTSVAQTQSTISTFLSDRASVIASAQPDYLKGTDRLSGVDMGGGDAHEQTASRAMPESNKTAMMDARTAQGFVGGLLSPDGAQLSGAVNPFSFGGDFADGTGVIDFSTSLVAVQRFEAAQLAAKEQDLGFAGSTGRVVPPSDFNAWLELHSAYFRDTATGNLTSGNGQVLSVGADFLIHRAVVIGVTGEFDWVRESTEVVNSRVSGAGWMAGPYLAARLTPHLTLDARATFGRSSNQISPDGTVSDDFATSRSLIFGRLTGDWRSGAWRLSPSAALTFFRDDQAEYTDHKGNLIAGRTQQLGRFTTGSEISYTLRTHDGSVFAPFVRLQSEWDFNRSAITAVNGNEVGTARLHGKVEAGASFTTATDVSVSGSVGYDGIGSGDYHAAIGLLNVNVPLN